MVRINRKLISIILAAILMLSLPGCSSAQAGSENPDVEIVLAEQLLGKTIYHYRISMSRDAAEALVSVLNEYVTLDTIIATLKAFWKDPKDYELEVFALLIMANAYIFKETLQQNMGVNGVLVDIWGLKRNASPEFDLCLSKITQPVENLDYCIVVSASGIQEEIVINIPIDYESNLMKAIENTDAILTVINSVSFAYTITPSQ